MRKLLVALAGLALLAACVKVDKSPPANLPPYVQLYPGATPIMHIDVAGMTTVALQSPASPDTVISFYRNQAASNGLQESSAPATGASADQRQATFTDPASGRMLIVVAKPQGSQTLITIAYKAQAGAPS